VGAVGLLYVGAVLVVNGIMLLGHVDPRGAAPLNLFVGALQVVTPTYLIIFAAGDEAQIALAAGLYFFGFTYLWVGINAITGWPAEGLGWFSLIVALAAVGFAVHSWVVVGDAAFGVIWLLWAALWFAFFLLMALHRDHLARPIGVLAAGEGLLTAAVPAFLIIAGWWDDSVPTVVVVTVLGVLLLVASAAFGRSRPTSAPRVPAHPGPTPIAH
jgi:hypothetical protein